VNRQCYGVCRFKRTFRNPHALDSTWNLTLDGSVGGTVPSSITVPAGGSVSVDLVLRSTTPSRYVWSFGGLVLTPADPSQNALRLPIVLRDLKAIRQDYDADGFADIHWRNIRTGQNDLWLMQGAEIKSISTVYNEPDQAWKTVGSFSMGTASEVLWRNTQTGAVYLQDVMPQVYDFSTFSFTVPDQNWQIVAIGDFSGTGSSSVIWHNAVTGRVDAWAISKSRSYASTIYEEPDVAWKVKGAGDFNGDGYDDIFWRNDQTGKNYVYFLNGYVLVDGAQVRLQSGYLLDVPDQAWQVAAIGDFDGDGRDDIYWRNRQTGFNDLWLMDGLDIKTIATVYYEPNQAWEIVASADYNNDGFADLLWRNASTGDNYMMLMRGTDVLPESTMLPRVADPDWRVTGLQGSN
jgi:peptidyl-Asp metalloendopeptidase